jgi:hypothetical protein
MGGGGVAEYPPSPLYLYLYLHTSLLKIEVDKKKLYYADKMSNLRFKMPEQIPIKHKSDGSVRDPIAPSTAKLYKSKLNKFAAEGYDTPEKLMQHPVEVIAIIKKHAVGSSDLIKQIRRIFLSAIFYVLPETYTSFTNPYHQYYQEQKVWTETE